MVIASAVGRVWTESTKGGPHSSAVQGAAGHRGPSPQRRSDGRGWPGGIASQEGNRASKAAARQAAERRAGSREGCSPSANDEKGGAEAQRRETEAVLHEEKGERSSGDDRWSWRGV